MGPYQIQNLQWKILMRLNVASNDGLASSYWMTCYPCAVRHDTKTKKASALRKSLKMIVI